MTTLTRDLGRSRPLAGIRGLADGFFSVFLRNLDAGRTRKRLESLTDEQLHDIGVERRDIDRIARRSARLPRR